MVSAGLFEQIEVFPLGPPLIDENGQQASCLQVPDAASHQRRIIDGHHFNPSGLPALLQVLLDERVRQRTMHAHHWSAEPRHNLNRHFKGPQMPHQKHLPARVLSHGAERGFEAIGGMSIELALHRLSLHRLSDALTQIDPGAMPSLLVPEFITKWKDDLQRPIHPPIGPNQKRTDNPKKPPQKHTRRRQGKQRRQARRRSDRPPKIQPGPHFIEPLVPAD